MLHVLIMIMEIQIKILKGHTTSECGRDGDIKALEDGIKFISETIITMDKVVKNEKAIH